jgi:hypothetical protein
MEKNVSLELKREFDKALLGNMWRFGEYVRFNMIVELKEKNRDL